MPLPALILPNERELFVQIADGNEAAFAEVFYHYRARLYPFIKKIVRSEEAAEDILQEVFVSLWRNRGAMTGVENHRAYIFTMANNKSFNYLKSVAVQRRGLAEVRNQEDDFTNNTQELIDLHQSQVLINELVEQLPPQKKLIYKLTREEGLSHEEIAQRLKISKNTVKNHLIEALKFLRERLQNSPGASLTLISIWIKIHS
jgi:RNA polymerase sigma-70 factor (ECF subfamily)